MSTAEQMRKMKNQPRIVAPLDQSGESTPHALARCAKEKGTS
jgi:hypothetical protein